jgi:predicted RND superfamily exporter protein
MDPRPFYLRFGPTILTVAASILPLIIWGVRQGIVSNTNDVRDWLPREYPETQQYRWFRESFEARDFIVASWPGCTLGDARLDRFARQLTGPSGQERDVPLFARVHTGRSLFRLLTSPPVSLDPAVAIDRLRGVVVGPGGSQTCAVVFLSDEAAGRLGPAIQKIRQAAVTAGVPRDEVRVGGIPVINDAMNRESTSSLVRLAGLSGLLGVLIAWLCFRDPRLTALVLIVGAYSAALSLAVVPMTGTPLNAVLITMVPLVYVTAVSGAIHLTNYYLEALADGDVRGAPDRAVRHAAVPLLLAAGTTALGLLSLCYSELNPIRMFGAFSAIGVLIGSATQFLLLPAALAVIVPGGFMPRRGGPGEDAARPASHLGVFPGMGRWVVAHRGIVLGICLAAMCIGAIGLPRMSTSIQFMRLFAPDTPVIPMTRWLEEKLGATIPVEVVIRFLPESRTTMLERMRLVAATHGELCRVPGASGCLSAATFAPPALAEPGRGGLLPRIALEAILRGRRAVLRDNGWIAEDGGTESWRISLRVRGIDDLDFAALAGTIRRVIEPVRDARLGEGRPGVDLMITGTAPIVFKARRSLLNGMLFGLATDIALIVVGLILLTRSWPTGAVMFLVGIFPTAVVLGSMGLLGFVVDIGAVMTPCVAVGVTVDDVIHLLLCHRRGARRGMAGSEATLLAYDTCGRAIFQSWGVIGIGLSAFALSSFVPIFRFGLLMFLLLTAGMLANLLFLPALLAGPLGRWIARSGRSMVPESGARVQPR